MVGKTSIFSATALALPPSMAVYEAKYKHFEEKTQNILEAASLS